MEHFGINCQSQHLLHNVQGGMFVKKEFWRPEWVFDAKRRGPFIAAWIDSCQQDDLLDHEEWQKTVAAFRHGYREGLKGIRVKFESLPPHLLLYNRYGEDQDETDVIDYTTSNLLSIATESARDARSLYHWKCLSALQEDDAVGRIVYPVSHWQHAAYLRGIHFALEHLVQKWNETAMLFKNTKRSLHDMIMLNAIPTLLEGAEHCLEHTMSVSLFPMRVPLGQPELEKQDDDVEHLLA